MPLKPPRIFSAGVIIKGQVYVLTRHFHSIADAEEACLKELGSNQGGYTISQLIHDEKTGRLKGYQTVKNGHN